MSKRRYRLIPDDLYQRLIKDDPALESEFSSARLNQSEVENRDVESVKSSLGCIDLGGFIYRIYKHPKLSWDKSYRIKIDGHLTTLRLDEVVAMLNDSLKVHLCNPDMLLLVKHLYDNDVMGRSFNCKDSSGKQYLFSYDSFWAKAEDYPGKFRSFES